MENGILTMIFKQVFKKYLALFTSSAFYKSTWYLTFGIPYDDVDTGIERMNEMTQQAQKALLPFNASLLSVYNTYISEVADYLSLLLNAEHNMIPLSSTPYHPVFVILNGILVLMFLNCVTTNRIVKNSQRIIF